MRLHQNLADDQLVAGLGKHSTTLDEIRRRRELIAEVAARLTDLRVAAEQTRDRLHAEREFERQRADGREY